MFGDRDLTPAPAWGRGGVGYTPEARTIATMPALIASGRAGQRSMIVCRSRSIKCACAALTSEMRVSRGFFTLFDSPRGCLMLLHRIASGRNSRFTLREPQEPQLNKVLEDRQLTMGM